MVVDAVAVKNFVPGSALNILAAVFIPVDLRIFAQDASGHEWADVQAHAIIQIRIPAYWLLFNRLPADEDVIRIFAFQDLFEFGFEFKRSRQLCVAPFLASAFWRVIQSPR